MKIPSVMSHQFSQVPHADIPRSQFDRSRGHKTTLDAGYLCPLYHAWVVPGDTVQMRAVLFGRLATPLKPIMDNMVLDTHFFLCLTVWSGITSRSSWVSRSRARSRII